MQLWGAPASAAPKTSFNICWTIYAGWMPWDYAQAQGIVAKWARKYGIDIQVTQLNDYVESLNQYTAGKFDGCTTDQHGRAHGAGGQRRGQHGAVGGQLLNGNDGIVLKGTGKTLEDLKGQSVHLVQFSVSHYLLARGLEAAGLLKRDIKVVNTSDADIVGAFAAPRVQAVVTWNPQLSAIAATPGSTQVFDSSKVPGEIIDLMVVNSATLKDNPALGKALTGAWFEVMALMKANDGAALTQMAKAGGATVADYRAQLATTAMMYTAAEQLAFVSSPKLPDTMKRVAQFSFDKGLLGEGARSADAIGMSFPGGTTVGNAKNTKLRFDATYLKLAADGEL